MPPDDGRLTMLPELILAAIRKHQPSGTPPILLACSGGIDSQVLLHSAAAVWPAASLMVAHVHHGLQPQADDWLDFCRLTAAGRGLPFMARRLPPLPDHLQSGVEAWARRLRYRALADMAAQAGAGIVLTAHHANDQLETHQLRRLRGAGPLGLGAMRSAAPLPGSPDRLLLRPFLGVDRQRIIEYAHEQQLEWVDDPSNQDLRYARNRIRRLIAQALAQDPGNLQRGLAEIDEYQQQADAVRRQARQDLAACRLMLAVAATRWSEPAGGELASLAPNTSLSRASLSRLPRERSAEAIRLWLEELGCRMPSRASLAEMLRQLLGAQSTHARLHHDGQWLLRYRDRIDAASDLPVPLTPTWFRWSGETLLNVAGQQFLFHPTPAAGVDEGWLKGVDLMMDRACGNDRLRLAPGGRQRSWKNLSQERGIAPWLRAALPVLRYGEELLFAAPFGMNSRNRQAEPGMTAPLPARDGPGEDLPANAWRPAGDETAPPYACPHAGQQRGGPTGVVIEWVAPPQWSRWL